MKDRGVWTVVSKDSLEEYAKILTKIGTMKKKESGNYRARINSRGFKQVDGVHYNGNHFGDK